MEYISFERRSTATRFSENLRHIRYKHPKASVASHVLDQSNQPYSQQAYAICYGCPAFSFFKDVRKPIQLDQIIFIRKRQKEIIKLLNEYDGNV
jgi:hypothetical protein